MNLMNIEELHRVLLELLKKFDEICVDNDIEYSIGFGTMLGAIRHKGFIPWDDDVDILITRQNFEKLCSLPEGVFGEEYFFQTVNTDSEYPYNTARLRKNNTSMIYEKWKKSNFHQGIYIDIIPLDEVPDNRCNEIIQKIQIILLTPFRFAKNKNVFFSGGKNIPYCIKRVLYAVIHKFPIEKIYRLETKIEQKYLGKNTKRIAFISEGNLILKKWYPVRPILKTTMDRFIRIPFEDTTLMCSAEYELLLTQWYGEYMKLPPKEKRVIYHQPEYFSATVDYSKYLSEGN